MWLENTNIDTGIGKSASAPFWRHHLPVVMRHPLTLAVKAIKLTNRMGSRTIKQRLFSQRLVLRK